MNLADVQRRVARINARQRRRRTKRRYKRPNCEACGAPGHYQNNRKCPAFREPR